MKKAFLQFLLTLVLFFALWLALMQAPWTQWFRVKEFTKEKQEQFGKLILDVYGSDHRELKRDSIQVIANAIKDRICEANGFDTGDIEVHVFDADEINAFAIPGGHIIVNTGLIEAAENAEMLAGVMAHEIGHIRNDHLTKKLAKEVGLATIIGMTGNTKNIGIIRDVLEHLTSTGFDRTQEREADKSGVVYLTKAQIDPKPLSDFFKIMAKKNEAMPESLEWISTHPDSKERASAIIGMMKEGGSYKPVMDSTSWNRFKNSLK